MNGILLRSQEASKILDPSFLQGCDKGGIRNCLYGHHAALLPCRVHHLNRHRMGRYIGCSDLRGHRTDDSNSCSFGLTLALFFLLLLFVGAPDTESDDTRDDGPKHATHDANNNDCGQIYRPKIEIRNIALPVIRFVVVTAVFRTCMGGIGIIVTQGRNNVIDLADDTYIHSTQQYLLHQSLTFQAVHGVHTKTR